MKAASRYTLEADPWSSHSIILRWSGPGRGRRALDVGAADGLLSRHLTAAGWRVVAIEGDPTMARQGSAHCERMVVADLDGRLPVLGEPFDLIVYGDVLEHLKDPLGVLQMLNRTLAPDGRVLVSVPNIAHLWVRLNLLVGRFDYTDRGILDSCRPAGMAASSPSFMPPAPWRREHSPGCWAINSSSWLRRPAG